MAQRRQKASPKKRSRSTRQSVESLRRTLKREREQRREALEREREALEQQTATADILGVISRSPSDIEPVLQAVAERAALLCEATDVHIRLVQGELMPPVVQLGSIPLAEETKVQRITRETVPGRAILECRTIHIHDIQQPEVRSEYPESLFYRDPDPGFRTALVVPLVRGAGAIGSIAVRRAQMRPFSEQQIKLLQIFAAQAVIAIENVRLFNETKEALERQTATAEILKVISRSPTATQPVFESIVQKCHALYRDSRVGLRLIDDGRLITRASTDDAFEPMPIDRESGLGACVLEARTIHLPDLEAAAEQYPRIRQLGLRHGYRSGMFAPLLREGRAIGGISVQRRQPGAFSDKDVTLLTTFADQAVIAIENVRLFNETKEALERQTATSEILRVISGSPTDIAPVFDAILKSATELCGAHFGNLNLRDGEGFRTVAQRGANAEFAKHVSDRGAFKPVGAFARMTVERQAVQVPDLREGDAYRAGQPDAVKWIEMSGARSFLAVPLLKEGQVIGGIAIYRPEVRPFTDQQIALVSTFADQAVIAIENVRLFNETKEALERQTATAEVLKVISRSPTALAPVFEAILKSSVQLCDAHLGLLSIADGDRLRTVAHRGGSEEFAKWVYERGAFTPDGTAAQALAEGRPYNIADERDGPGYRAGRPNTTKFVNLGAVRSFLAVPLMKDGHAIGNIGIYRPEVRPFSEKQVALVGMFANQAVIAIENVRLFNETKEALERQTGTADILKVIAASPADVQPVFDAILAAAMTLCHANMANVYTFDGELIHLAALVNRNPEYGEAIRQVFPRPPGRDTAVGRAVLVRDVVEIPDVLEDREYGILAQTLAGGFRSALAVPLIREKSPIGAIIIGGPEPGPFPEKQVALLKSFADQAVIAIENARLFNETKEALERQTATSEILRVISGSPTNVQPVFDAIARCAVNLCGGLFGAVFRYDGENAHFAAHYGFSEEALALMQRRFPRIPQGLIAPPLLDSVVSHSPDALSDPRSAHPELLRALGVRGFLGVPMLLDGRPIGAISVFRRDPGPFTDAQIGLLRTFADQAVIAIENARLFNETKEALEQQTATGDILRVIAGSPTNTQPVFDAVCTSAARLCDAYDALIWRVEGEHLAVAGHYGPIPTPDEPLPLSRGTSSARAAIERRTIHHVDLATETEEYPLGSTLARRLGFRTALSVPLIREGIAIGVIHIRRREARAFSDKQIQLLKLFADQAVIAIENARLFNETKEALEQQTATADILGVISRSPTDVAPVLETVAMRAAKICDASDARIWLVEGDAIRHAAGFGDIPITVETGDTRPIERGLVPGRAILDRAPVHVEDIQAVSSEDLPLSRDIARHSGWRTALSVPLLREARALGAITLRRVEVRPFTVKQISLLKTFADQAVIAIENVRLFNETKEALERQTATAEVLKVISRSPSDIQPVFDAVAESAARLCNATDVIIRRIEGGGVLRAVAHIGSIPLPAEVAAIPVSPKSPAGRAVIERRTIHIHDVTEDSMRREYPEAAFMAQRGTGFRTLLVVPLVRNDAAVGTIAVRREEKHPFSDQQIGLLQTFADQAVIAIENVRLFKELQATNSTLREALEQQTASADILKAISGSPTDVQPVFDTIVRNAVRLGNAAVGFLISYDGTMMQLAAHYNVNPEQDSIYRPAFPRPAARDTMTGRSIIDGTVINLPDIQGSDFGEGAKERARRAGYRSALVVPMLHGGISIGSLNIQRAEAGAFPEPYVALLQTFADQAVIAIENVRLFNELRSTNASLREALDQRTATAEILRVISSSPSDLKPVFDTILDAALRLCEAQHGQVYLYDGAAYDLVDSRGADRQASEPFRHIADPGPHTGLGRILKERRPVHIPDLLADAATRERDPVRMRTIEALGARTFLAVPLLKDDKVMGALVIYRREVQPFDEQQVALIQTFAAQAVIAIENVRLFNETKEALEQQTAISEVLRVISSSPADVLPVLEAVAVRAARICDATDVRIFLAEADELRHVAGFGDVPLTAERFALDRGSTSGRAVVDRMPVHVHDILAEPDEAYPISRDIALRSGWRTALSVPLIRENRALGAILLRRLEVRPFSEKQIALLKTFSDQAAIAIENVRLFKELQERTEALTKSVGQLTALGEVGQAISSTLELETVLKTIVSRAVQLSNMDGGSIYEYDERAEEFRLQAAENMSADVVDDIRKAPTRKGDGALGHTAMTLEPTQVPDTLDNSYRSARKELLIRAGYRALLAVPLLREGHLLGALLVNRKTPGPFAPEVVDLLKTFATQSALAIQNARLFREIAEKGKQLEVASHHKSQFLASMSHELRTPLNAILGFNEMMLDGLCGEVPAGFKDPLDETQKSGKHLLRLINNVLDLAKIEAGRMELALADYSVHDTVESVRSTLRPLAAEKGLEFLANVPADIPLAYGDAGRITQCLMNLAGNSLKFTKEGRVEISVQQQNGQLRYCVADTGIGIPPESIGSLFTEFKQTDATIASEYGGTGLGLSITKKFIEMHGGRIWVESEIGKGSAFIFEIPLKLGK